MERIFSSVCDMTGLSWHGLNKLLFLLWKRSYRGENNSSPIFRGVMICVAKDIGTLNIKQPQEYTESLFCTKSSCSVQETVRK